MLGFLGGRRPKARALELRESTPPSATPAPPQWSSSTFNATTTTFSASTTVDATTTFTGTTTFNPTVYPTVYAMATYNPAFTASHGEFADPNATTTFNGTASQCYDHHGGACRCHFCWGCQAL